MKTIRSIMTLIIHDKVDRIENVDGEVLDPEDFINFLSENDIGLGTPVVYDLDKESRTLTLYNDID